MILRSLLTWTLGAIALAYTPNAPEILSRMEAVLRRVDPVQARVVREDPGGEILEEAVLTVPGKSGSTESMRAAMDLPYILITLPTEELIEVIPTVALEDTPVTLGRLDGNVCYILEGENERLWISKGDLLPLKIEILSEEKRWTVYLYLDMVNLSEKVRYPSRTEVWSEGELVLVERLLPSTASTDRP